MSLSCFELGEQMLSVDAARDALMTLVETPVAVERVALGNAYGRRLATDITAPINVPQNTNAAMDGVALAWPKQPPFQTHWPVAGDAFVFVFPPHHETGDVLQEDQRDLALAAEFDEMRALLCGF